MAFNSLIDNGLKAYKHNPQKIMMNEQLVSVCKQMMMMMMMIKQLVCANT